MEACSVREVVLVARAHQIFHLARVNNDALMGLSIRGLNLRLMTSGVSTLAQRRVDYARADGRP